jgi:D-sedoheptulose 7-phosphate isomerase
MKNIIEQRFKEHISVSSKSLIECQAQIVKVAQLLIDTLKSGKKILICGNGGSAADSQHFAAELVSSFSKNRNRDGIPAIALTTDTSIMTAYSNDFNFEGVFARQVNALGQAGDCLIVLSTSGNSKNCIMGIKEAKAKNLKTVALIGENGSLKNMADEIILVPSNNTQNIQEMHILIYHILSELIEENLFTNN